MCTINFVVRTLPVLIVALTYVDASASDCGPNEQWMECTGCELKCGQGADTPCPAMCRPPSCQCLPSKGLRRDANGKCIPESQCPKSNADAEHKCPENEEYTQCKTCEESCEEKSVKCTRECKGQGCQCNPFNGFVRHNGKCIRHEDCPK